MDKKKVKELSLDVLDNIKEAMSMTDDGILGLTLANIASKIALIGVEVNKPDWISVKDDLPPYGEKVWCRVEDVAGVHYFQSSRFEGKNRFSVLKYDENGFDVISVLQHVTHWRKIDKLEV